MSARHLRGRRPMTRRERLEAAVAAAFEILDRLDGDEDLEPDSYSEAEPGEHWAGPATLDRYLAEELRP